MFFQNHEKAIYSPPDCDRKFDPLALERTLRIVSGGRLPDLLADWTAGFDDRGDVSSDPERAKEIQRANAVLSAQAEGELVRVARVAFELPPFPDSSDATALEYLQDYLEWMAGKGTRGSSPQPSTTTLPVA